MPDLDTFGGRVKQARREYSASLGRDVSQREVATMLGVTYKTVSRWESNVKEPDLTTIRRLARALNANPAFLAFGLEGESGWLDDFGTPPVIKRRTLADKTRIPDEGERAKEKRRRGKRA